MAVDEPAATLAIFRRLPSLATEALEKGTQELASSLAVKAAQAARGAKGGAQGGLVAGSVKARRAAIPIISMGGSALVGRNAVPVFKVMYGSEFGSNTLAQFRPHVGRRGYWFFPTLTEEQEPYTKMWHKIADAIADEFTSGGGGGTIEIRLDF